jgi:hypothetical protein
VTIANHPTLTGKSGLANAIGGVWKQLKAMSHSISGAWSLHDGAVGVAESLCMYTRPDGTTHTIRPCTILRRRAGLIYDLRIGADMTQL